MLLKKRIERAVQWLSGRKKQDEEEMALEKNDTFALILSALITILPIALLTLLLIAGIPMLLMLL